MSEDVVLGGARFSWLQNLSDAEILRWPEVPPSFPDDITSYAIRSAASWVPLICLTGLSPKLTNLIQ